MLYNTTRNKTIKKTFSEIVCASNAQCGGLYIPEILPSLKKQHFTGKTYVEIAQDILEIFTEIPKNDIEKIVKKSSVNFTEESFFLNKKLEENLSVIELFHGPTLSFKDYPMQFLGNIIEYILLQTGKKLNILTATSGDTGSAAIHAFANKENIKIIVLHPEGKVTEFQRKQMTTFPAKNVFNIAVNGTFDDCQKIVKDITNSEFAVQKSISTVNSINWGRIMMQMVYYIKILTEEINSVNIFVPTGNFGNIFACYFLKKCGFEGIQKMFISNNANNVISQVYQTSIVENKKPVHTISPAIDIAIPSNFERMLYLESNTEAVKNIYKNIQNHHHYQLNDVIWNNFRGYFEAYSVGDDQTLSTMKDIYNQYGYVIDPHTAVAFAHFNSINPKEKSIIISTAHPCKFEDAVKNAIKILPTIPKNNENVVNHEESYTKLEMNDISNAVMEFFN